MWQAKFDTILIDRHFESTINLFSYPFFCDFDIPPHLVAFYDTLEGAGGLSREYVLRIPSVSKKATKGAPLYSYRRWCGVKQ